MITHSSRGFPFFAPRWTMAAIGADIEDDSLRWTSCEPRLSPSALSAIKALGFARMTPVQGAAIPAFLSHKVGRPRQCGQRTQIGEKVAAYASVADPVPF